jgi:UDP-N-acetylglucosamine 2-epimerase (non-hydrolysing)
VTAHRAENVDNAKRQGEILKGLKTVGEEFSLPVIFPVHPRTRKNVLAGVRALEMLKATKQMLSH